MNVDAWATALLQARASATRLALPTATEPGFTLNQGYQLADELRRRRIAAGDCPRGYKIGFTNRSIWPRYGVHAPIWAPVWSSTLDLLDATRARLSLAGCVQPRLEPEIVFGLGRVPRAGMSLGELAACLDWVAHGFEIVHTHFDDWRFQAPDTVADFGLHGRLLVGPRVPVAQFSALDAELAALHLELRCDGRAVDQGLGSSVLDGPLRALKHGVDAMAARPEAWPWRAGDVVTTGTLTDAWPLLAGQTWETRLDDTRLPGLTLTLEA